MLGSPQDLHALILPEAPHFISISGDAIACHPPVKGREMNKSSQIAIEKAVVALLQPDAGRFIDQEIVARALPIALWRERLRIAIQVYTVAVFNESSPSNQKNGMTQ
jgi:hypothetical protein